MQSFTGASGERTEHVYDYAGTEAIRREFSASGEPLHETLYFSKQVEVRDGRLVRWIWWNDERVAETTTQLPEPDKDPAPRSAAALVGLLLFALALTRVGRRLREPWPRLARPVRLAGQRAIFVLAALSCRHDEGGRPLLPDEHTLYHVSDRLGSAALVLDHQGEPIARDAHDPYGAPALAWRAEGEPGPDYRFTGAEDTPASGAVVLGARHYLPALGRWSSPDPYYLQNPAAHLDRPGERNLYRYAANNPVQHIDPTGHGWASWLVKGVVRIFKGASKADEVASVVEDAAIIVSRNSSFGARVLSAFSLGTEYLPVSVGDIKDGVRWLRGSDRAADAAGSVRLGGYRELRGSPGHQSHHIIQNKAVKDLTDYDRDAAPAVRLQGSTGDIGSQHYKATAIQREAGGGTYASERRIGYKALRAAGLSAEQSRQAIEFADRYFQGIGVTPSTPTNIPKNRK